MAILRDVRHGRDGWLPPDNYQETGSGAQPAPRTSPTNIAMGLLSALAAHDLGYLSTTGLVSWLDRSLTTLEGLERHEGHFLNWYDTTSRAALRPRYVSTVDSGNLAASLIALSEGLRQSLSCRRRRPHVWKVCSTPPPCSPRRRPEATPRAIGASRWRASTSSPGRSSIWRGRHTGTAGSSRWRSPAGTWRISRRLSRALDDDIGFWSRTLVNAIGGVRVDPEPDARGGGRAPRPGTASVGAGRRDALRVPVRPTAPDVHDWLSTGGRRRARPRRRRLLRLAGVGSAPGQLRRDCQGRRAAAALVPPGAARHEHRRSRDADVVGRHDVRVPDAAAVDAQLSWHAARPELPREHTSADGIREAPPHPLGHFRIGLQSHGPRRHLSVQGIRSAGARPEARARRRPRRHAIRDRPGEPRRPRGGRDEPRSPRARRRERPIRVLRIDRLHRPHTGAGGDAGAGGGSPRDRPRVFRASPGHVARRAGQRRLQRRVRETVPRRSPDTSDRAAAAGARAARGDRVRATAGRGRNDAARGTSRSRRAASGLPTR